jgi:hypothetical protein
MRPTIMSGISGEITAAPDTVFHGVALQRRFNVHVAIVTPFDGVPALSLSPSVTLKMCN